MLALMTAGCLPRGNPPAGFQLIADRGASLAAVVPSDGDGLWRDVYARPAAQSGHKDLYVVALDAANHQTSEILLIPDYDDTTGLGCNFGVAPCSEVQPRSVFAYTKSNGALLVDPVTGDQLGQFNPTSYAPLAFPVTSPSGQRFFLFDQTTSAQTPTSGTLFELDGTSTRLADVTAPSFTDDNDFYYAMLEGDLFRVAPDGTPERLATGLGQPMPPPVTDFGPVDPSQYNEPYTALATPDGTLLILRRPTSDPAVRQAFAHDPLTGQETAMPFDPSPLALTVSPDGRWLLDSSNSNQQDLFTFFDYRANQTETADLSTDAPDTFRSTGSGLWRPGHDEVWTSSLDISAADTSSGSVVEIDTWVLRPGDPPVRVPGLYLEQPDFTPDGTYWLATPSSNTSKDLVQVGLADDPTGPLVALNPPQTVALPIWVLQDDRVLAAVYTRENDTQERTDAVLLDPRTGDTQIFGERGRIAAVGQTRVTGMFHFDEERGDLTVSEYDTGRQTVLAPEFTTTAFAEPQGADSLAPGTRIVYQFQARTDSPYDGIWIATCP